MKLCTSKTLGKVLIRDIGDQLRVSPLFLLKATDLWLPVNYELKIVLHGEVIITTTRVWPWFHRFLFVSSVWTSFEWHMLWSVLRFGWEILQFKTSMHQHSRAHPRAYAAKAQAQARPRPDFWKSWHFGSIRLNKRNQISIKMHVAQNFGKV